MMGEIWPGHAAESSIAEVAENGRGDSRESDSVPPQGRTAAEELQADWYKS
jgi:hypothetical protein